MIKNIEKRVTSNEFEKQRVNLERIQVFMDTLNKLNPGHREALFHSTDQLN